MIKNAHIVEEFEKKEAQNKAMHYDSRWYERADQLYEIGLKLNKEALIKGGSAHLKMLVEQRKKIKMMSKKELR